LVTAVDFVGLDVTRRAPLALFGFEGDGGDVVGMTDVPGVFEVGLGTVAAGTDEGVAIDVGTAIASAEDRGTAFARTRLVEGPTLDGLASRRSLEVAVDFGDLVAKGLDLPLFGVDELLQGVYLAVVLDDDDGRREHGLLTGEQDLLAMPDEFAGAKGLGEAGVDELAIPFAVAFHTADVILAEDVGLDAGGTGGVLTVGTGDGLVDGLVVFALEDGTGGHDDWRRDSRLVWIQFFILFKWGIPRSGP
jgi:hypothetical protein